MLKVVEPTERHKGNILVVDDNNNDVAEFYHNEHATVQQNYEQALMKARRAVAFLNYCLSESSIAVAMEAFWDAKGGNEAGVRAAIAAHLSV